jgi:hypothetical protein
MRIKALPLSQSKQEKRSEGVITIQRDKDSWNQKPQTSGSSTPPLTLAPPARVPASMRTTTAPPPLQRTHRRHRRRQHRPPFPLSRLLPRGTCSITTTPPPLEHHLACRSPIEPPPPAPSVAIPSKTLPIKSPLPNCKQFHFLLPRP